MRLTLELALVAAIIYLGWNAPLNEQMPGFHRSAPAAAVTAQPNKTPGAWMWDPNRRTALDTPRPAVAHPSVSGSWMWDPNHHATLDPPHNAVTPSPY